MARHSEGWRFKKLSKGRKTKIIWFWHNGRKIERSCGTEDPRAATEAAKRIYADFIQREPPKRKIVRKGDAEPLEDLVSDWLSADTTLDPKTKETWTTYGTHWAEHWPTLIDVTDVTCVSYRNNRLTIVMATTVRKELSAFRRFLAWCRDNGHLHREVKVCGVPKKATGTRYAKRRRTSAPELTPEEISKFIAHLPEWSTSKKLKSRHPIRARFVVAYETGLRPGALDELRVPEHYQRGATTMLITDEIDKSRWGRELPLSDAARAALDRVCPDEGLIFGKHDYRPAVKRAAEIALPPNKARRFNGSHLRSACATHDLEATGNLPGVQYKLGHLLASTTARYTKPSFRAAEAVNRSKTTQSESGTL